MSFLLSPILRAFLRRWGRIASPQTRGVLRIPGLKNRVEVRWDRCGVPHLVASHETDLFMAQGYLHAQERLWQMDFNRRFLSGRMAEIIGEDAILWKELSIQFKDKTTADFDYFIRLAGIRRTACASLKILTNEFADRLFAYCSGVNRYIETHLNRLPLEFRLLRYEPEPWSPEDSLTIGKGFAFFLSTSLFTRLAWIALAPKLSGHEAKLRSLAPAIEGPSITRSSAEGAREILEFLNGTFQRIPWPGAGGGSNSWVIAPSRSTTGNAILCNDPHLRMTLPSTWYLMHLKTKVDGFEVWGASIPGSPCVHLGQNRWIAWGVTAALCDDADLYVEKIHPANPDLYLAGSQWEKMRLEEEEIRIRGGKKIKRKVRLTRHGPVITDFSQKSSQGEVLAFRWTAHDPSQEFLALYGVNRARDWDGFVESLSYQTAPTLNYVYADIRGNIGYSLAGRVPIRPKPHSFFPLPGWSEEFDWKGYIPFSELPRLYNPAEGAIATANNRITDDSYPYYLSDLFDPPYRARRISELLTAKEKLAPEDMMAIQRDTVSVQARDLIRQLKSEFEELASKDPDLKEAAESIASWDGNCTEDSTVAALYHVFYQRVMFNLFASDLGHGHLLAYAEIFNQLLLPMDRILKNPQSPWFESAPRQELIRNSLREAQAELSRRLGGKKNWQWGRIHTLTFHHPMGSKKLLAPLFSVGPWPSPGDGVTINMGFYRHSDPYQHIVGASLRTIIDPSDPRSSRFILSSGQSGHCFSPHYTDQTYLWRRGEYLRLYYETEDMRDWPLLALEP